MNLVFYPQIVTGRSAVALGYFDGLHRGHAAVIAAAVASAAAQNCISTVLTFDMSARRASGKGLQDLATTAQKIASMEALGAARCYVLDFAAIASMSGEQFVEEILSERLNAISIFCGWDFRFGKERQYGVEELEELCQRYEITVNLVPDIYDGGVRVSTSRIKAALTAGDMATAARLLGRPYGFALEVYRDKGLAGTLGFPTINQHFPAGILPPRFGVYRSRAAVGGRWYDAISNIGHRPTVGGGSITIETHLLDFEGSLYGQTVPVELLEFMREEKQFDSAEALRKAVRRDIEHVRDALVAQEL